MVEAAATSVLFSTGTKATVDHLLDVADRCDDVPVLRAATAELAAPVPNGDAVVLADARFEVDRLLAAVKFVGPAGVQWKRVSDIGKADNPIR